MADVLKLFAALGELLFSGLRELLDGALDKVFLQVLDLTCTGSIVIVAVLLLRLLLKKQPKLLSYALWAVVLFRLLAPWSPEADWGVLTSPETGSAYTLSNDEISFAEAASAVYEHVGDALNGGLEIYHVELEEPLRSGNDWVPAQWWEVWILFGRYIWAAGVLTMAAYSLASLLRLRRKLRCAMPFTESSWTDSAVEPPKPSVWLADGIQTPFVVGLFRPKIYLPSDLPEQEREYILLHEQHHIRRGDHWWRLLGFLALCLHWFNPLVWAAFLLSGKDMEMSCDEAVIRKLGDGVRQSYSASLLNLSTGKRIVSPMPLAFGEGDAADRIRHIMNGKKSVLWAVILSAVLLLVSGIFLMTNAAPEETPLVGTEFYVKQVLYDTEQGPAVLENGPRFTVTTDYRLCIKENHSADRWEVLGQLETYPLTLSELRDYTAYDKGWLTGYDLRTVTDAYILRVENDGFYLVFQTKNGHTFLGYGWEDVGERGQGASDDTGLEILYRLA